MSKAVLVMQMPESCSKCSQCIPVSSPYCSATGKKLDLQTHINEYQKPAWCPLKPMPEAKEIKNERNAVTPADIGRVQGWNACLKQLEI